MIFALGSRLAQPLAGLAAPESYYTKAMGYLETIVGLHDLKNAQVSRDLVSGGGRANDHALRLGTAPHGRVLLPKPISTVDLVSCRDRRKFSRHGRLSSIGSYLIELCSARCDSAVR